MGRVVDAAEHDFDHHVPLIVIGAGACGLVAALKAHDLGAELLVLEQDDAPSGSTALSSGFIPAAGTRFQAEQGIEDSPALFAEELKCKAKGLNNPDLVRTAANNCGLALEWLADRHGLEWIVIDDFLYPGHSCHRMHAVPERTGTALMARLINASEQAGIPIATGARVTTLSADGQIVRGLEVERGDGSTETIGCDALILACCGFGGSHALIDKHIPAMSDALFFGHAGNKGDALQWAAELGAAIGDITGYQGHGSVAWPHGILISWALMMQGAIQVNLLGKRFANEHLGYSEQAVAVLQQPEGIAWNIFDEELHQLGMGFDDYRQAADAGAFRQGRDLRELCRLTSLPEAALQRTFDEVAECREGRGVDALGRDFAGERPLRPPYYAVKVTGAMFHTQGGAMIDGTARVVDADGMPLGNLYAGGGAACGVSGPEASGYLSGNGLLTAVAFGAVAGEAAAKSVVRPAG